MNIAAKSERAAPTASCPACGTPVDRPRCPACGLRQAGDEATELRWIEAELRRIGEAKTWLLDRRKVVLADVARMSADDTGSFAPPGAPEPSPLPVTTQPHATTAGHVTDRAERTRHELSRRTAGRLLLAAGAVLVMIAITAFTVANWSSIGSLGRCAILLAVTAAVLAAPAWLRRRVLPATAESVAAIGLALTIADAYLARQLFAASWLSGPGESLALAAAVAVLAALWACYGVTARLQIPRLAAIVAAQFPGVIAASALTRALGEGTAAGPIALALLLTCAADLLVGRGTSRAGHGAMARTGWIAATTTWVAAVLLALGVLFVSPAGPSVVLWMSAVLVTAAAIGVGLVPLSAPRWLPAAPVAAVSGGLLATGLAFPAATIVRADWQVVPFALAGVVVAGACLMLARVVKTEPADRDERSPATSARLRLVAAGSTTIAGAAGLIEIRAAVSGMFPLQRLTDVWSGPAFPPPPLGVSHFAAGLAPAVVLGLVSLACWVAPVRHRSWRRLTALAVAVLAVGSIPAAGLTSWAALAVLTTGAALMLGASTLSRSADRDPVAIAAACGGVALALSALLWSLTWVDATITELAVLTAMFCVVAVVTTAVGQLASGCAVAAATGLACAAPLASGWPVQFAAFAVLGVATVAVGIGTLLRRVRPRHALVLDACAGLAVLLAAMMAARHADGLAVLASIAALCASSLAWLRTGQRKSVVLCGALVAAVVAIAADVRPLALALFRPYTQLASPWHGPAEAAVPRLALAVVVLGACAVAVVTALGAWRGGRASLDALAVALPLVVAPAGLAGGLHYELMVGLLLVLAVTLTAWTSASRSLAPAGAALATATLALAWALAAPVATLVVLGALSAAYALSGWRARRQDLRAALPCLSVLSTAAFAEAAALAAGWPAARAGLTILGVAAGAQLVAARLRPVRASAEQPAATAVALGRPEVPHVSTAIEAAGWFAAAAGTVQCLSRPGPAIAALALSGLLCIGVSARADRRPAVWLGLALGEAAWCVWLVNAGVTAPETYTVPAAAASIAYGWRLARRLPRQSSWARYGPGLALLLVPSLLAVWHDHGWIRPLSLGVVAGAITLLGGRVRLQAPLLIGAAVTVLDAGHELAPAIRRIAELVPTWLPIAVVGAILLWAGATYEARLRNLSALRKIVRTMR